MLFAVARTVAVLVAAATAPSAAQPNLPAESTAEMIVRQADRFRGLDAPYRFRAEIRSGGSLGAEEGDRAVGSRGTVVEVRSDGGTGQLIVVLEPHRGDLLLKVGDVMWLRPRRLQRVTRVPPHLRMFHGAAVSDVSAVDLPKNYRPSVRDGTCNDGSEYVLDLESAAQGARYPRATYWVACQGFVPRRIEFMSSSGRVLKAVSYAEFATVLGQRIVTRLIVEDHIFRDISLVQMSEFELIAPEENVQFSPDYLLTLPEMRVD